MCLCASCQFSTKNSIKEKLNFWIGREIKFPNNVVYNSILDTIHININSYKYKIISIIDAEGCISCRLNLREWMEFNDKLQKITSGNVGIIKYISPHRRNEALYEIKSAQYKYPVCIDVKNEIDSLNHFSPQDSYRCFLLDENNKVILVGDPIQNSKIKDLYFRTICDSLNIEYRRSDEKTGYYSYLGSFKWTSPQKTTFNLKNTSSKTWHVDSIYTSCECTLASIDNHDILPNDSTLVNVTFTADRPEHFLREIYIEYNNESITMTIEGDAFE